MTFFSMFRKSAMELKSVQCLAVTGVLVACYVVLNSPMLSFNSELLKITFGYIALRLPLMLYGPVVAMIAAIPCDIITAAIVGLGINPFFMFPKILEGLIYGLLLYGYAFRGIDNNRGGSLWAAWQVLRIAIARLLVMLLCYFILNNVLVFFISLPPGRAEEILSQQSFWAWAFARNGAKNIIQYPIDLAMMLILLPALGTVYNKIKIRYNERKAAKT